MTLHIEVPHAELVELADDHWWRVTRHARVPGGQVKKLGYHFPRDMLEIVAAELDIDPDDRDLLLDIVMYRPSLPLYPGYEDGSWLYDAPSVEHAREEHLAQIRAVKGGGTLRGIPGVATAAQRMAPHPGARVLLDSEADDPLEVIKAHSPISTAHMAARREYRDHHRGLYARAREDQEGRRRAAAPVDLTARQGPDELRERLFGARPRAHDKYTSKER